MSIPTLDAYAVSKTSWCVWCHWCENWHTHGSGEGHRVAHCACRLSPYQDTGYNLRLVDGKRPKRKTNRTRSTCFAGSCDKCGGA